MKAIRWVLALLALVVVLPGQPARAADVICYNCPPEWADWASMLKAIKTDLNYDIRMTTRTPARRWRRSWPRRAIRSATSAISASPSHEGQDPGRARALQAGALGSGRRRPEGSRRLLDHDPFGHARPVRQQGCARRQAGAGLLEGPPEARLQGHGRLSRSVVGRGRLCRRGRGQSRARRSSTNFDPGVAFFKDLQKNQPIVPKQTSYARVVSGEIPILFDYDFNAYRAKYSEKGNSNS